VTHDLWHDLWPTRLSPFAVGVVRNHVFAPRQYDVVEGGEVDAIFVVLQSQLCYLVSRHLVRTGARWVHAAEQLEQFARIDRAILVEIEQVERVPQQRRFGAVVNLLLSGRREGPREAGLFALKFPL